jgi:exodeoxyribonuclease V alpha subunit
MSVKIIERINKTGCFSPLDLQMAGLALRMAPGGGEAMAVACALASRAIRQGHTCVDLKNYQNQPWKILRESQAEDDDAGKAEGMEQADGDQDEGGTLPSWNQWKTVLRQPVVGDGKGEGDQRTIFVLNGSRLYLRRYWEYERNVENILESLKADSGIQVTDAMVNRYFGKVGSDEQKQAVRNALQKRLSLLSGGPGTGKTFTLARVVALFDEIRRKPGKAPVVYLVAPTGKAAVRMEESIKKAKQDLLKDKMDETLVKVIPEKASTIHRLLGASYQSPYFKHDRRNKLVADMVIVDEASMVDLPLMAKLLEALPEGCNLMLVGDIAQLASVEPGRVYGDLCNAAMPGRPLDGCLTRLTTSRRFAGDSAIGRISQLINRGCDAEAWKTLLEAKGSDELQLREGTDLANEEGAFSKLVAEHMDGYLKADEPAVALAEADKFRVLCALRKGPCGVNRMNRRIEQILSRKGLKPSGRFYDHQLIMIKVNTPALNLFNGDIGVVMAMKGEGCGKEYQAWFPDANKGQGVKPIPVNLLPDHETAFAMTVHKAQGSEYPYVALILPDDDQCQVLTRELLYTGMTRVKIDQQQKTGKLAMWCGEAGFTKAVRSVTSRATGLFASKGPGAVHDVE